MHLYHFCFVIVTQEEPHGDPMPPSVIHPLHNLQFIEIESIKYGAGEIALLGTLLQIAPHLKELKLPRLIETEMEEYKTFLENRESLMKGPEQGTTTDILLNLKLRSTRHFWKIWSL